MSLRPLLIFASVLAVLAPDLARAEERRPDLLVSIDDASSLTIDTTEEPPIWPRALACAVFAAGWLGQMSVLGADAANDGETSMLMGWFPIFGAFDHADRTDQSGYATAAVAFGVTQIVGLVILLGWVLAH